MFGSLLVTPTLIDSCEFARSAPPSWKERAMKDFVAKIKRETITYPDWVQAGMDFEDTVYRVCNGTVNEDDLLKVGSSLFQKVTAQCFGGSFQNKLKKNLVIGEHKAFFFGYSDVEKPTKTIDIKTCIAWKGDKKYLSKMQHKLYLWMNGKKHFEYVVAEWTDESASKIKSVNTVSYDNPGHALLELDIVERTKRLFNFIHEQGLWKDYYYIFSKN